MATKWTDPATGNAPYSVAGLRILIAEDSPDCAETMAALLRMYGHDVEVARSGPTALAAAQAHPPDVLLLDLGLPGMSGYEVAERLTGLHWRKNPLIVAVTGYAQEDDRRRSAESGIDLHLAKPVDPERLRLLLSTFQRVIGGTVRPAQTEMEQRSKQEGGPDVNCTDEEGRPGAATSAPCRPAAATAPARQGG